MPRSVVPPGPERRPRTSLAALVVVVALLLLVPACSPGHGGGRSSDSLVVGATAEPPNLNATGNDAAAIPQVLLYNVYQTLVKLDDTGKIIPLLATAWEVSNDRLTYTFHLDPSATFAGGRAVTGHDVVWSIERVKKSGTAVLKAQMSVVKSVTAPDEHTVVVRLARPSNLWLFTMTQTGGMIFDSTKTDFDTTTAGSGPYTLGSWTKGSAIVLDRRSDYHGPDAPTFATVTFRYFTDPNAMNAAMLSGGLDIISNLQAPQALDQFSDTSRFTVIDGTTNGEVVMSFNFQNKALQDKRVRQAICYAINRQALLDTVWNGKGTLIGSMVPPTDPWYQNLSGTYPYDPAKAKQLLQEAGYGPDGKKLTLRLRLPTLPYAVASGQFVASALEDVGITIKTDELEFPARWLDVVFTKGDYDMSIIAHVEARDIVKYGQPDYYWHYDNPTVQRLLTQADEGTPQQQITDMRTVAKILADDAASDWLFLLPNLVITKADIHGVPKNATGLSFDLSTITRS